MIQFADIIKLRDLIQKTYANKVKLNYEYKSIKFNASISNYKNHIDLTILDFKHLELPQYAELYCSSIHMNGFNNNLKAICSNSLDLYNYITMMLSYLILMKNESKNKLFIKRYRND